MDFRTTVDQNHFWVRATALIVREDQVYLCKDVDGAYHTIGGAISVGETTEEAVVREVEEEIGCRSSVDHLAFIVENHFSIGKKQFHRIEFVYLLTPLTEPNPLMVEGEESRRCEWVRIDELEQLDVKPVFLKTELKNWDGRIKHIVNMEDRSHER
ncbi:NUDIX domain-containing protein [Streptococcus cameli]